MCFEGTARPCRALRPRGRRGAPAWRRAEQHLDHHRPEDDPEALSPASERHASGGRDRPLPDRGRAASATRRPCSAAWRTGGSDGSRTALAMLQQFVRNQGDAWRVRRDARSASSMRRCCCRKAAPDHLEAALADYMPMVRVLGQRTGRAAPRVRDDDGRSRLRRRAVHGGRHACRGRGRQGSGRACLRRPRALPARRRRRARERRSRRSSPRREECGALIGRLAATPGRARSRPASMATIISARC